MKEFISDPLSMHWYKYYTRKPRMYNRWHMAERLVAAVFHDLLESIRLTVYPTAPNEFAFLLLHLVSRGVIPSPAAENGTAVRCIYIRVAEPVSRSEHPPGQFGLTEGGRISGEYQVCIFRWVCTVTIRLQSTVFRHSHLDGTTVQHE